MWLARADERPQGDEAVTAWLYDWWQRIDTWIDRQGEEAPMEAQPGAQLPAARR